MNAGGELVWVKAGSRTAVLYEQMEVV